VTAIGVLSICVAALTAFGSLCGAYRSFAMVMFSTIASNIPAFGGMGPATPVITTATNPSAAPGEYVPMNGYPSAARQAVLTEMTAVHPLSAPRRIMLDMVLSDAGITLFALGQAPPTTSQVRSGISASGRSTETARPPVRDYFVLGTGRLEIQDNRADFFPVDGSNPLRWNDGTYADISGLPRLSAAQVPRVINQVNRMSGGVLNRAQETALIAELTALGQSWITTGSDPVTQVAAATRMPSGDISLILNGQSLMLISDGTAIGATSVATTAPAFAMGSTVSAPLICALVLEFLDFLLAVYLFVCGILVLRQSWYGARLHWLYVWVKLPLVLAGLSVSIWLMRSMQWPPGIPLTMLIWMALGTAALGLAYPVGLIFALRSRPVRAYYSGAARL
jgi:hypothetical protein